MTKDDFITIAGNTCDVWDSQTGPIDKRDVVVTVPKQNIASVEWRSTPEIKIFASVELRLPENMQNISTLEVTKPSMLKILARELGAEAAIAELEP